MTSSFRMKSMAAILFLAPAATAWGALPLSFEPNRGQTAPSVDFIVRSRDGMGFLVGGALTFRFRRCAGTAARTEAPECRRYAFRMRLAGARRAKGQGLQPLPGVASYFHGADPSRWI